MKTIITIVVSAILAASAAARLLHGGTLERITVHEKQEQPAITTPFIVPTPILPDVPVIVCEPFTDKKCSDEKRYGID